MALKDSTWRAKHDFRLARRDPCDQEVNAFVGVHEATIAILDSVGIPSIHGSVSLLKIYIG